MEIVRNLLSIRFTRFLAVGGIAALINIISRILLDYIFTYETSIVIAFFVALLSAYVLNRMFVFSVGKRTVKAEFSLFLTVNLIALVQVYVISVFLAYYLLPAIGINEYAKTLAHAFAVATPAFTSYLLHKRWTFRA